MLALLQEFLGTSLEEYMLKVNGLSDVTKTNEEKWYLLWNQMMCIFYESVMDTFLFRKLDGQLKADKDKTAKCFSSMQTKKSKAKKLTSHQKISTLKQYTHDALEDAVMHIPFLENDIKDLLEGKVEGFEVRLATIFGYAISYVFGADKLHDLRSKTTKKDDTNQPNQLDVSAKQKCVPFRKLAKKTMKSMLDKLLNFDYQLLVTFVHHQMEGNIQHDPHGYPQLYNDLMLYFKKGMCLRSQFPPMEISEEVANQTAESCLQKMADAVGGEKVTQM